MLKKALALIAIFALALTCRVHSQNLIKKFSSIGTFTQIGSSTYFLADDGNGKSGLWKTDGTTTGTILVKSTTIYINADYPRQIIAFNNKAYFAAGNAITGTELWQTDGTEAGTKMLKEINPQHVGNTGSDPNNFVIYNGALYFTATEDSNQYSLWKTDGTEAGTTKVFDAGYTSITRPLVIGNTLYFTENNGSLWKSDGTNVGTRQILIDNYGTVEALTNVDNELVFFTSENYSHYKINLYKLNPTDNTPVLLGAFNAVLYGNSDVSYITAVGNKFFFAVRTSDLNGNSADALWISDKTPQGTKLVTSKSYTQYLSGSNASNFVAYKDKLYFAGTTDHTLWTSDGTPAGTVQVSTIPVNYDVRPLVFNDKLYFVGNSQLSYFDGTKAGTDLHQPLSPAQLTAGIGQLYFQIRPYGLGSTLWSNAPAPQLQVSIGYQTLGTNVTAQFRTKADSTVTSVVTAKNIGKKEILLNEISVAGTSFYVNGTPPKTLLPGQSANFNLLYSPFKEEDVNGLLIIKTNDNSGITNFTGNLKGTTVGAAKKNASAATGGLFKTITFQDSIPDFTLSQNTIPETAAINTIIGTFNLANSTAMPFTLIAGLGDADNGSFKLKGGQLKLAATLNFDIKSTYTIRVQAGNAANAVQKTFGIQVTDIQPTETAVCKPVFQDLMYTLNDVAYTGTRIVAVGGAGKVLISDDDGKTWRVVKTGIDANLMHLRFTDSNTGYALGGNNTIYKTENRGEGWFPLVPPAPGYPNLTNFYFISSNTGYVFGANDVYKTIDGGRSWQKNFSSYNTLTCGWFTDQNNGFICGTGGTLIHTTDGGKNWETISVPSVGQNTPFSAIAFVSSTTGYMVSSAGDILKTTDGGKTWPRISTVGVDGYISQIKFTDERTGYLLGGFNGTYFYKTTDGGQTWASEDVGVYNSSLLGMAINTAGNKICVVGHGAGLGYTSEQGSVILLKNAANNWEQRSVMSNNKYSSGNLFASGTGYIFGEASRKTIDGGITWKKLDITYSYLYPGVKGYFLNDTLGFYADYFSIYKTTDGAATWKKTNTDSTSGIRTIHFVNPRIGFYSTDLNLYKTTDGGDTWKKVLTPSYYSLFSISFPDEQTGYIGGIGSTITKTSDGGNTWRTIDLGNDKTLLSVGFFDTKVGMAGGINGSLFRTTDGGETWNPVYAGLTLSISTFQFVSPTHAYLLNTNGTGGIQQVFESKDAGLTWGKVYETWQTIFGFRYNDGHLFLTGDNGSMIQDNNPAMPPVNAGYITGDTISAAGAKIVYSIPPVANTNYKWAVAGAQSVEYQNSQVIVAWKGEGPHTLQVTPYNDCYNGEGRSADIEVIDMPEPTITGPDTAQSKAANVAYVATIHDGNNYSFTAANSTLVTTDANKALVNWDKPGVGTVTVVESNPKLGLKKSASKNVIIKEFKLPENNFSILVNSVACKGSNNGFITIRAVQALTYKATVISPGVAAKDYAFTDSLKITGLAPGVYNICLSVTGNTDYKRCYDANVTEPKDITLYTVVNPSAQKVTLNLSGADNYTIDLNGAQYQTSNTQIDLPLIAGANRLRVYSDKPCQGVIEKIVNLNKVTLYPNPFTDRLSIDLGGATETSVNVDITNAFGLRVYSKKHINNGEPIEVATPRFNKGVYILTLTLGQSNAVFKIIKQ